MLRRLIDGLSGSTSVSPLRRICNANYAAIGSTARPVLTVGPTRSHIRRQKVSQNLVSPRQRRNTILHERNEGGARGRNAVDPKVEALAESRTLNPHPEAVQDEAFAPRSSLTPGIWCRSSTRWCAGCGSTGRRCRTAAAAFGFSRPSYYTAARSTRAGWPALVPARPGPRGRTSSPTRSSPSPRRCGERPDPAGADLVGAVADRFGVQVHPRSVERALAAGGRSPKSGGNDDDAAATTTTVGRAALRAAAGPGAHRATPTGGGSGWRCCARGRGRPGCGAWQAPATGAAAGPAPRPTQRRRPDA